jgi:hypothetical protein
VDGERAEPFVRAVRDVAQVVAQAAADRQRQELAAVEAEALTARDAGRAVGDDAASSGDAFRGLAAVDGVKVGGDDAHGATLHDRRSPVQCAGRRHHWRMADWGAGRYETAAAQFARVAEVVVELCRAG